jgi:hypothetical protein
MKGSIAWRINAAPPVSDVERTPRVWLQATKDF